MTRPRLLAAAVAWVLVVAVGSTVVWAVISRAGDQVVSADRAVPAADTTTGRHQAPGHTGRPGRGDRSSAASSHPPSSAPSSSPASSPSVPSPTGAAPPPSSGGQSGGSPSSPAGPAAVRRTWQGQAGLVVAECRGAAISLVSTQPNVGYHAELKERGPEALEVEFSGREEDSGTTVTVRARCAGGAPDFSTQVETENGGSDD